MKSCAATVIACTPEVSPLITSSRGVFIERGERTYLSLSLSISLSPSLDTAGCSSIAEFNRRPFPPRFYSTTCISLRRALIPTSGSPAAILLVIDRCCASIGTGSPLRETTCASRRLHNTHGLPLDIWQPNSYHRSGPQSGNYREI